MTMATALCLCLVGLAAAQNEGPPPLACNLKAIPAAKRPHYNDLMKRLRAAVRERREIPEGYVFKLDSKMISLTEVGEWMGLERLCCPFFDFQLSPLSKHRDWLLELKGPPGAKLLIEEEFPTRTN